MATLGAEPANGGSRFPESERDFFVKAFDAQLTLETDSRGRAMAIVLHQGGATIRAKRIE
jgi:hypothetical protein